MKSLFEYLINENKQTKKLDAAFNKISPELKKFEQVSGEKFEFLGDDVLPHTDYDEARRMYELKPSIDTTDKDKWDAELEKFEKRPGKWKFTETKGHHQIGRRVTTWYDYFVFKDGDITYELLIQKNFQELAQPSEIILFIKYTI